MWAQLLYSAQGHQKDPDKAIKHNTARAMRSTAALYYSWDLQVAFPGQATKTKDGCLALPYIIPTDELCYTLQQGGMARRLGTQVKPSHALQHKHVKYINDRLEQRWHATTDPDEKREIACAATANLSLWTSWLRGGEAFALNRKDTTLHPPAEAPLFDLPTGQGFIGYELTPETKSSPSLQVDLEVAYACASGLSLGIWMERLMSFPASSPDEPLFSSAKNPKWDSKYFRQNYLWPLLEDMRATGEPSLQFVKDVDGQRIKDHFYSCHSYRRGSETACQRKDIGLRKATAQEIAAQARWRVQNRGKEPVMVHYTEWDLFQRLALTCCCL